MARKPLTLRLTIMTAAAFSVGSSVGVIAENLAVNLSVALPTETGHVVTAVVTVWILDKLNALIEDDTEK